jgi:molecular chaperone GrpE (heat shock protein)
MNAVRVASKTITDVAEKLKDDFEDPLMGYRVMIRRLGNDAIADADKELEAKKEALKQSMDGVRSFINRSLTDVEKLRKNTWDTAKILGFSIHLTRLANIINGEPVERVEALATMKMTIDAFTDYLNRNQLTNRCPSASKFSDELMGAMRARENTLTLN